jgi:hypothetical protein
VFASPSLSCVVVAHHQEGEAVTLTLDRNELMSIARNEAGAYRSADPFPHCVLDDFLPASVADELARTFPETDRSVWRRYQNPREVKLALEDETMMPDCHRQVMRELNGHVFVDFLEALTGVTGLIPDPHFRGSGLHQIVRGGLVKIHADFDMNPRLNLHRRVNAILYLNENWAPTWGGELELWDTEMRVAVKRIQPIINRLVIFSTTDTSFHGHPEALACPPGRTRRSMAWYYYEAEGSTTDPGHTTLFRPRPGEKLRSRREELRAKVIAAVPPSVKRRAKRLIDR